MYRIVFLDIDGTILNSKEQLEERLINTVKKAQQKGIIFGIATGRSLDASKMYGEQLGCSLYITYNGSLVYSGEEIVHDVKIPAKIAYELCSKTEASNGTYIHFSYHQSRSNQPNQEEEHLLPFAIKSNVEDTNHDAHRLALYMDHKSRNEMKSREWNEYVFEERNRLEIYPTGSKWTGIKPVIHHLGVLPEEVITIGNGVNDVEMLEAAGLGVAMGNAPDFVKKKADIVVEDNDHHGVASALERIFEL